MNSATSPTKTELLALLPYLTSREREQLDKLTDPKRGTLWAPNPGPQTQATKSTADVIGFGGRAGGGKSYWLLGTALTNHRRAVIFRREATQAHDLFDNARELVGKQWRTNETFMSVRSPDQKRKLQFAGLKDANDVLKWRGRPNDFVGFDEADQFLENQVRTIAGWIRTTYVDQRCLLGLTFNPPSSPEGRWIIQYFGPWIDRKYVGAARNMNTGETVTLPKAMPGEIRWFAMLDGVEIEVANGDSFEHKERGRTVTIRPTSRTFIPASLQDNPYLMATDYERQLMALPEPLRSQVAYGDFDAGVTDSAWQVIPSAWLEAAHQRYRDRTRFENGRPIPPDGCSVMNALGIDVARGGKCKTVLAPGYDNWYPPLITFPGKDTPDGQAIVGQVATLGAHGHRVTSATIIKIDVLGVGSSPYDHLKGIYTVEAMNSGPGSTAKDKANKLGFVSRRAQWYWQLREALDPVNGDDLMIAPDSELDADLTAPTWGPRSGKIWVEPKEEIEKRIGRSPDKGDSFVYARAEPAGGSEADNAIEFLRLRAAKIFENEHTERHRNKQTECPGTECQIITEIMKERGLAA